MLKDNKMTDRETLNRIAEEFVGKEYYSLTTTEINIFDKLNEAMILTLDEDDEITWQKKPISPNNGESILEL
jgi:hypothetical protein